MKLCLPKVVHSALLDCAAKGDTRYAMNGIHCEISSGRVYFVSSDTHRMTVFAPSISDDDATALAEMEAARRAELTTAIDHANSLPVSWLLTPAAVKARWSKGSRHFLDTIDLAGIREGECIDGQFPRWRDVMPQNPEIESCRIADDTFTSLHAEIGWNLHYLVKALPILKHFGNAGLKQSAKDGPGISEMGARPWKLANDSKEKGSPYGAYVLMPVRQRN